MVHRRDTSPPVFVYLGLCNSKIYTGIGFGEHEKKLHIIGVSTLQERRRKTVLGTYCFSDLGCPYNDHRGKKPHEDECYHLSFYSHKPETSEGRIHHGQIIGP